MVFPASARSRAIPNNIPNKTDYIIVAKDEADLQQLFDMIDTTGEGEIKSEEFIAALSRWVHDSKTAPRFVKYNVQRALQMQDRAKLCELIFWYF